MRPMKLRLPPPLRPRLLRRSPRRRRDLRSSTLYCLAFRRAVELPLAGVIFVCLRRCGRRVLAWFRERMRVRSAVLRGLIEIWNLRFECWGYSYLQCLRSCWAAWDVRWPRSKAGEVELKVRMSLGAPVDLRTCGLQIRLRVVGTGKRAPLGGRRRLWHLHRMSFPVGASYFSNHSSRFRVCNPLFRPELPGCRGFQVSARYLVCVYVSLLTMYSHDFLNVAI